MDYRSYYRQASTRADELIAEGNLASAPKSKQMSGVGGFSSRQQPSPLQRDDSIDMDVLIAKYMADVRKSAPPPKAPVRESPRPQARPSGGSSVSVPENRRAVVEEATSTMEELGYPDHVIEGFLMNYKDESNFNVDVVEAEPNVHGTRGKGLYQLTGSRRDKFEDMFGGDYSVRNQMLFQDWELNNTETRARDKIFSSETAGEAGANIVNSFLRPAAKHARERTARYTGGSS